MDGRGRALDNVFIERFWRSLKQEKIYLVELYSVADAKKAIADYMDFYNLKRKHQSLGYKVPFSVYSGIGELRCWEFNNQNSGNYILDFIKIGIDKVDNYILAYNPYKGI